MGSSQQERANKMQQESSTIDPHASGGEQTCPKCQGRGTIHEWSIVLVILAALCLGTAFYLIYRAVGHGAGGRVNLKFIVAAICLLVFGLYPIFDRSECKECGGMGTLESDTDEDDDPNAEWAQAEPPE